MTRSAHRLSAILALILSFILLFCGCQAGIAAPILPDIPTTPPSQGKEDLFAALNKDYAKRFHITGHFVRGGDTTAEAVFQYLLQNDSDSVEHLLTQDDTDEYERAHCAAQLTAQLQEKSLLLSGETLWVSYAELPADALTEDGFLREGKDCADIYAAAAHTLIDNQCLLVFSDVPPASSQQVGLAAGIIGEKVFVIAVFSA